MNRQVFINGRFRAQPLSGVQRFAIEITSALARLWPAEMQTPILLTPRLGDAGAMDHELALPVRQIGRRQGHAWEQLELPRAASSGVLVNLGNTAPIFARSQLVVIHDAAVFSRPDGYNWKFRAAYKSLQWVLAHSPAEIVTVSNFSRNELVRNLGLPAERIKVITEGADHIHAAPATQGFLAANDLATRPYVLVVGNLARHKNLQVLGQAARQLAARGIDLVITGGFDARVFGGVAAALPQPARYLGRVSDAQLRALYESALCFVFPSTYEGFGLPAGEAMLCGCPVVAAATPALVELCGDAALFCDPASPAEFADAIVRLADDPGLAAQLRRAGLARAASLTWDAAGHALFTLIERLAVIPGRPARQFQSATNRPVFGEPE